MDTTTKLPNQGPIGLQNNIERTTAYKDAFKTLWCGVLMFIASWVITLSKWWEDTLQYAKKHYLAALIIIGALLCMLATTIQACYDRENANKIAYQMEMSRDSLKLLVDR